MYELPRETVRKGSIAASGASIIGPQSSEIELLGPVSSGFEASVRSLSALFGQFLEGVFSETELPVLRASRKLPGKPS